MPDYTVITNEAAMAQANEAQTGLALSFLKLFNSTLIPTGITTAAQMIAAETALVGYPVGGYPITAFSEPGLEAIGRAVLTSPLIAIVYASGATAVIGGGWIEDAAGNVRAVFVFDPQRSLAAVGDQIQFVRQLGFGNAA